MKVSVMAPFSVYFVRTRSCDTVIEFDLAAFKRAWFLAGEIFAAVRLNASPCKYQQ